MSDPNEPAAIRARLDRIERVICRVEHQLAAQGDRPDRDLLALQHDLCDLRKSEREFLASFSQP